jgi:hypothetical protein
MPYTEVMHKWKAGTLRSGGPGGPKVKSQKQAIAIMLSEKRASKTKPEYRAQKTSDRRNDSWGPVRMKEPHARMK